MQSVNDVEQIRVVDSAMKEKWRSLEGSQLANTKVCLVKIKFLLCVY